MPSSPTCGLITANRWVAFKVYSQASITRLAAAGAALYGEEFACSYVKALRGVDLPLMEAGAAVGDTAGAGALAGLADGG